MSLESSTVSTSLDAIRGELARTKLSTSTLNFVVWIDDPARRDWIVERAGMLSEKHPSFTLILDHSGACAGAATVTTSPRNAQSTITVDSEKVEIDVCNADAETVVGYITGLTKTNVPTVLWWSGINEQSRPIFYALLPLVTTLLVDSSGGTRDDTALRMLVAFHEEHPHVELRDLAWMRLRPWQDMIANFFDDPNLLGELFTIRALHIASGSDSEALYLGGWLASRLGWTPSGPAMFTDQAKKQIAFKHRRVGDIRRVQTICLDSETSWYHGEVSEDDDTVVKVWVEGEHAREPRLFPLQAIDNASLLERAVLEPGMDELFETALKSAGTLLG
jgi:glucose-6-phosphate dehydrogenase assembly protein OpcA